MNRILVLIGVAAMLGGCATKPVCGNAPEANAVYFKNSCKPRIRQVLIGSKLNILANINSDALSNFDLRWTGAVIDDGIISLGHYSLVPKNGGGVSK